MPPTSYIRPNLWPWTYASIPDFSAVPSYSCAGTAAQALRLITQTRNLTLSISWNVDYGFGQASDYSRSVARTLPDQPLPIDNFSTGAGYYYSDTAGALWASPAERVLPTLLTAGAAWPELSQAFQPPSPIPLQGIDLLLRATRTGALTQTAFYLVANDPGYATGATCPAVSGVVLATIPFSLVTPEFTITLKDLALTVNAIPPLIPVPIVNSFTASMSAEFW